MMIITVIDVNILIKFDDGKKNIYKLNQIDSAEHDDEYSDIFFCG